MQNRLQTTLDKATFDYSEEEMNEDINIIDAMSEESDAEEVGKEKVSITEVRDKFLGGLKKGADSLAGWVSQKKQEYDESKAAKSVNQDEIFDTIKRLKELLDMDIISQEEFDAKKSELMEKIK